MNRELKEEIVRFVFDNVNEFQINNAVTEKFRPYIYDASGNYLISGEEVAEFITKAIRLVRY